MLINGLDASVTYGFKLSEAPAWRDLPPRSNPSQLVLGKQGAVATAPPTEGPRRLTLRGHIVGASPALARSQIDAMKLALLASSVQLIFDDDLTRYVSVILDNFTIPFRGPEFIERKLRVDIQLTALDPYYYSTTLVGPVTLDGTGNNPQALGTAPSPPIVTILGAKTNPLLRLYKSPAVDIMGQLGVTVVMIGGDTLVIDMGAKTVKLNGVSRLDLLTGDFFSLDPVLGTVAIQLTADAGAGTGSFTYRKAWR